MVSLLFFCLSTTPASAQVAIKLSEVFPAPSTESEWIELANTSAEVVDISGWQLFDQLSSPSLLHTFPSGSSIAANGFAVIETNQKLNNTADGVVIKDQTGNEIDSFSYTTSITDLSWSRHPDQSTQWNLISPTKGGHNLAPSPSPSPSPSPAAPTPSPSSSGIPSMSPSPSPTAEPISFLSAIEVSEIMACPSQGDTEWVELFNPTDSDYFLNQWLVKDADNHTKTISGLLPAQQLAVFRWSGSLLNNAGDRLELLQPDGVVRAVVSLTLCKSGQSWVLSGDSWQLTDSTPGETNTQPNRTSSTVLEETPPLDFAQTDEIESSPHLALFDDLLKTNPQRISLPPDHPRGPISATDSSWPVFTGSSHVDLSTQPPRLTFATKKLPTVFAMNAIICSWLLISVGSINLYENYLAGKVPSLAHLAQRVSATFGMGNTHFQFFSPKRPP